VFHGKDRLTVKEGSEGLEEALAAAGWAREALDWTLWREG
jgi:hypothetical protein